MDAAEAQARFLIYRLARTLEGMLRRPYFFAGQGEIAFLMIHFRQEANGLFFVAATRFEA